MLLSYYLCIALLLTVAEPVEAQGPPFDKLRDRKKGTQMVDYIFSQKWVLMPIFTLMYSVKLRFPQFYS